MTETVPLRNDEVTPKQVEAFPKAPYSKAKILKQIIRPAFGNDARFQKIENGRGLMLVVRHSMTGEQYPLVEVRARADADVKDLPWLACVFAFRAHGFDLRPAADRVEFVPWAGDNIGDASKLGEV